MNKDRYHIINFFKLLALIIIASELRVIRILISAKTPFEEIYILSDIPLICEYLVASLTIFIIGFVLWLVADKKFSNQN